jgi:hypothetical protein
MQKVVLVGVLSLVGIVLVWVVYIQKQIDIFRRSGRQIVTLQDQLNTFERETTQQARNEQLRKQIQDFIETQTTTMVNGDPFSWAVREISLFTESHPVRVVAMRPSGKVPHPRKPKFEVFNLRLEVEGTYDQLGTFLTDFENAFPTASIGSLDLFGGDSTSRRMSLNLSFLVAPEAAASNAKTALEAKKTL